MPHAKNYMQCQKVCAHLPSNLLLSLSLSRQHLVRLLRLDQHHGRLAAALLRPGGGHGQGRGRGRRVEGVPREDGGESLGHVVHVLGVKAREGDAVALGGEGEGRSVQGQMLGLPVERDAPSWGATHRPLSRR